MMQLTSDDIARGNAKEELRFKVSICICFNRKATVAVLIIKLQFWRAKRLFFLSNRLANGNRDEPGASSNFEQINLTLFNLSICEPRTELVQLLSTGSYPQTQECQEPVQQFKLTSVFSTKPLVSLVTLSNQEGVYSKRGVEQQCLLLIVVRAQIFRGFFIVFWEFLRALVNSEFIILFSF